METDCIVLSFVLFPETQKITTQTLSFDRGAYQSLKYISVNFEREKKM